MRLLRDLELSRMESFEQLRKDKEQSDLRIQEHIQRLEAREQERKARKRRHSRHNPQEKQTPKIPKFKGENDPNIYIEWEQKVDQIFTIHVVSDQKQVDLVVLEFEDYAMTSSLDKVIHLATKVETQLQKEKEAKRSGSYNDYYSSTWKDKERKHDKSPPKSSQYPPPRTNSFRPSNETPNSSQGTRTSSIKCFKCLGYGHIA